MDPEIAFRNRLEAQWTETVMVFPNENFTPPNPPAPYLAVEFIGGTSDQVSIGAPGNNRFREVNGVRIWVMVPSNTGWEDARDMARRVAALFRGKTFDGVRCWSPRLGSGKYDDVSGNWYGTDVFIPYQYDLYG